MGIDGPPRLDDVVELVEGVPELGIGAGALGTVIDVHASDRAVEVEVCDDEGASLGMFVVGFGAVRLVDWEKEAMEYTDRLLTPGEVAALFRVDPKTVVRWANTGRVGSVRTPGGHRRFRESEILALLGGDESP